MRGTGLMVPTALEARPTATRRVRGPSARSRSSRSSVQSSSRMPTQRTTRPRSSATRSQGATLASWSRRVTTISSPGCEGGPDGPAEGERDGRHVGPEADLVRIGGTKQVGRGHADVVDELVGLEAGREGAPVVGVAGEEVVVDGAQAGVHDLRPGRSVEPGDRLPVGSGPAQRGKAGADGGDVPVSHGPESSRRGRRSVARAGIVPASPVPGSPRGWHRSPRRHDA